MIITYNDFLEFRVRRGMTKMYSNYSYIDLTIYFQVARRQGKGWGGHKQVFVGMISMTFDLSCCLQANHTNWPNTID